MNRPAELARRETVESPSPCLLDHKDLRIAGRCRHLSPDFLTRPVSKLDCVFGLQIPWKSPSLRSYGRRKR